MPPQLSRLLRAHASLQADDIVVQMAAEDLSRRPVFGILRDTFRGININAYTIICVILYGHVYSCHNDLPVHFNAGHRFRIRKAARIIIEAPSRSRQIIAYSDRVKLKGIA